MSFLYFLEGLRNPVLDAFFSTVTHLGGETLFLAIAIIIFWCYSKKDGYYLLTVGFFGTLLNQFLKLLCRVPRPWVRDPNFTIVESARAEATGYSFPSGHTQNVTASLGCLARSVKQNRLRILCVVLIALTALSRMYLGVHTPADVGVSLALSVIMVFALYPVFQKGAEEPKYIYFTMAALIACSLAYVLFVELFPWPADIDAHNLESGIKNGYLVLGCSCGMLLSFHIERTRIHFCEKSVWWVQVLKTALGLALVLALKAGLKPVLNLVFAGHLAATAPRYFLIVVFAACLWPMTFPWFDKLAKKQ